ncbi:MAG: ABC transporter ATP-binding protein [Phycisphaeraceae bacterium]|nr:ABC transporter ATP-binding protein [Phycisphaeraceae bacterium]
MILCDDVYKDYRIAERRVPALRGLSLAIHAPGFYAVMGQSGSGKSTLLHLLAALDKPDRGRLSVAGIDLHTLDERSATEFRRRQIGIVFQQFNLIPTLSASDNVELPGMLAGEPRAALRQRARALLDELGLGDRADHRPDALSGGEQQRVAIARAMLFEPPVILADEPTGNLDSENAEKLWKLLAAVARQKQLTVVMVTHEPAAAVHCERVFVLQDGRMTAEISTEGLDASGVAARYQQCIRAA